MSLEQAVVDLERRNAALQEEVVRFRDAAMGLNAIYPSVTAGRQAVADGQYFSVPGNGAYMRLYRRNGASASLIAEFPERSQVQSLVDALGGRGVVGGSGSLLADGAYGLGARGITVTDWNSTPSGNVFLYAPSGSTPNAPPNGTTMGFQLGDDNGLTKKQFGIGIGNTTLYSRSFREGVWTNWDPFAYESSLEKRGLLQRTQTLPSDSNWRFEDFSTGFFHISGNNYPNYSESLGTPSWASVINLPRNTNGVGGALILDLSGNIICVRTSSGSLTNINRLWGTGNATVDSNGFIKAASPIFRLSNISENATDESQNFTSAGSGAANGEAQGVTAVHEAQGVYTILGSLGFATQGWTVEVPQDANGNRLCVVEAEQADDGTITVGIFSRRIDHETGNIVAGQPMDIPDGRWIDFRLEMPELRSDKYPDDVPAPELTPKQQEQERIEQLERWRQNAAVDQRQARLALSRRGLLKQVSATISSIEDEQQREEAEIEWEFAPIIRRLDRWVNTLYAALGLSQEDVDQIFREALQI